MPTNRSVHSSTHKLILLGCIRDTRALKVMDLSFITDACAGHGFGCCLMMIPLRSRNQLLPWTPHAASWTYRPGVLGLLHGGQAPEGAIRTEIQLAPASCWSVSQSNTLKRLSWYQRIRVIKKTPPTHIKTPVHLKAEKSKLTSFAQRRYIHRSF